MDLPGNPVQQTIDEEQLCMSCGLCCTGMMFSHVTLDETDNLRLLQNQGLVVQCDDNKKSFKLPCVFHENQICRIHHLEKPKVCRNFRCRLLKDIEKGNIDRQQAERCIRTARQARDRLHTALTEMAPQLCGRSLRDIRRYIEKHSSRELKPVSFHGFVLVRYLREHFHRQQKQTAQT